MGQQSLITVDQHKFVAKRTAIIIAHRLSTIRHVDRIIVLQKHGFSFK